MVAIFASGTVDHDYHPRLGQAKDYEFDICCFSIMYATLRSKSKNWLVLS